VKQALVSCFARHYGPGERKPYKKRAAIRGGNWNNGANYGLSLPEREQRPVQTRTTTSASAEYRSRMRMRDHGCGRKHQIKQYITRITRRSMSGIQNRLRRDSRRVPNPLRPHRQHMKTYHRPGSPSNLATVPPRQSLPETYPASAVKGKARYRSMQSSSSRTWEGNLLTLQNEDFYVRGEGVRSRAAYCSVLVSRTAKRPASSTRAARSRTNRVVHHVRHRCRSSTRIWRHSVHASRAHMLHKKGGRDAYVAVGGGSSGSSRARPPRGKLRLRCCQFGRQCRTFREHRSHEEIPAISDRKDRRSGGPAD